MATNASGFYRFCCNATPGKNLVCESDGTPYRVKDTRSDKVWKSDHYRLLREQFLRGEEPEMCERCFREERSGVESARQKLNRRWQGQFDCSVEANSPVKYIDLRLGNLCNLKCRMCNPYASSKWVDEWNKVIGSADLVPNNALNEDEAARLKQLDWPEDDSTWENLKPVLANVEEVYLTGGEPLLSLKQKDLLDHFIDHGHSHRITLKYNTNLTVLPSDITQRWKSFKKVICNVSIDGFGNLDEYIRFPTKWAVVENHLRQLLDLKAKGLPLDVGVHVTVQMYNILRLPELLTFLEKEFGLQPFLNILNHPHCFNIRTLPQSLKALAERNLDEFRRFDKVSDVLKYMNHENWDDKYLTQFFKATETMDLIRNQSLQKLVPEFYQQEPRWNAEA